MKKIVGLNIGHRILYITLVLIPLFFFLFIGRSFSEKITELDSLIFLLIYLVCMIMASRFIVFDYSLYVTKEKTFIIKSLFKTIEVPNDLTLEVKEIPIISIWRIFKLKANNKNYIFHYGGNVSFIDHVKSDLAKKIEESIEKYS